MPRNASGVYSLPESPFVAGTTIESARVNSNYSDIASTLTTSLATTGVSTMTGQFKAAAGSLAAPGIVFAGSLTTGFYRSAADSISWGVGGSLKGTFGSDGNVSFVGNLSIGGTLTITGAVSFTGGLTVGGSITGSVDLFITGSASIGSDLHVAGTVSIGGRTIIGGNLAVIGSVSGGLSVTATLAVGGDIIGSGKLSVDGSYSGKLLAIFEDNQSQGVNGAALTESGFTTRTLNTSVYNFSTSIVSLSANTITLQPGSYNFTWFAMVGSSTGTGEFGHQSLLINVTASSSIKRGTSGKTDRNEDDSGTMPVSHGKAVFTVAATATYQIMHQCGNNSVGDILQGVAASLGTEVYTQVEIRYA